MWKSWSLLQRSIISPKVHRLNVKPFQMGLDPLIPEVLALPISEIPLLSTNTRINERPFSITLRKRIHIFSFRGFYSENQIDDYVRGLLVNTANDNTVGWLASYGSSLYYLVLYDESVLSSFGEFKPAHVKMHVQPKENFCLSWIMPLRVLS